MGVAVPVRARAMPCILVCVGSPLVGVAHFRLTCFRLGAKMQMWITKQAASIVALYLGLWEYVLIIHFSMDACQFPCEQRPRKQWQWDESVTIVQ